MIENDIEKKLVTREHKKTFQKNKKEYLQLIRHLNGDVQSLSKELGALARAVKAVQVAHGMIPYDVQILSAIALMKGASILEISTGEGKTLVAALASCALALTGRRVHIYTPNDYLSKRDSVFTEKIAKELGLICSFVKDDMSQETKRSRFHGSDILYATERVVIFSYINDCTNQSASQDLLPVELDFLIADEADSILIDNGETPYIISEKMKGVNENLVFLMPFARMLNVKMMPNAEFENFSSNPEGLHAIGNSHTKDVVLLEKGYEDLENYLSAKGIVEKDKDLYRQGNVDFAHALTTCLMALHTYQRDVNYIVRDEKAIVVDEHTGRILPSVRISLGIHQAIEVKEDLKTYPDNYTKGKMTLENFISRYKSISGMTGTALDAKEEFKTFFGMRVQAVPPNKPSIRVDYQDKYYMTMSSKHKAIIKDIKKRMGNNQPILVGSSSVDEAEILSSKLTGEGVPHVLLTPKHEEKEAEIIAQAGRPGRVTVTTNMAGRGTDIALGVSASYLLNIDHDEREKASILSMADELREMAVASGGLHVIGTERSRSSRVDRQLVGRAGRQGDPGSTQFYISPEDKIFRTMGESRKKLERLFTATESQLVKSSIQRAINITQRNIRMHGMEQKRLQRKRYGVHEQQMHHYMDFRNRVKYDDDQRLMEWVEGVIFRGSQQVTLNYVDYDSYDENLIKSSEKDLYYFVKHVMYLDVKENEIITGMYEETAFSIYTKIMSKMEYLLDKMEGSYLTSLIRETSLHALDECWTENLARVEEAHRGIHFRSYAGEKPDIKYQEEAFNSYKVMVVDAVLTVTSRISSLLSLIDEQQEQKIA